MYEIQSHETPYRTCKRSIILIATADFACKISIQINITVILLSVHHDVLNQVKLAESHLVMIFDVKWKLMVNDRKCEVGALYHLHIRADRNSIQRRRAQEGELIVGQGQFCTTKYCIQQSVRSVRGENYISVAILPGSSAGSTTCSCRSEHPKLLIEGITQSRGPSGTIGPDDTAVCQQLSRENCKLPILSVIMHTYKSTGRVGSE